MPDDLKNILESLLFVADSPIDIRAFREIMPDVEAKEIREALGELATEYETRQGGFMLFEVAGGFQFRTRPDYKEWIKKLLKPPPVRLSKAALETLAIIAYHQPIIRADVERIRGVDSGAILRNLLERKLIRILGKKEIPGRPLIYATTRKFLEIFNLKSLSDMPTLKEIQEFGKTGLTEGLTAGLEEAQAHTVEATPDRDTADEEAGLTEQDESTPETVEGAQSEPEDENTTEAADGTFSRHPGIEPPGENETACNGQAKAPIAETDDSDLTESLIDTESSGEPVNDDQQMDSPDENEMLSPEQGLVRDNPENDDTEDEPGEENAPDRY